MRHLTFIISLGNRRVDIDRLIWGLNELVTKYAEIIPLNLGSRDFANDLQDRVLTKMAITPRQAHQSPQISISTNQAIGRICAESICPYPPGIPVLIPGEIITADAVDYLQQILDLGGDLVGCSDPTLANIRVVNR